MLIYVLIVIFVLLIAYQIFLSFNTNTLIEGLENATKPPSMVIEYIPYNLGDPNNSLILSQQNAGNIEVLKGRIDNLDGIKNKVDDMQQNINSMQVQMDSLVQQQADYAQELVGNTPPEITGTEEETVEDVEEEDL
jgi:TolA-binding protein